VHGMSEWEFEGRVGGGGDWGGAFPEDTRQSPSSALKHSNGPDFRLRWTLSPMDSV